jgi:rSAM/selenodomain-associated transferase 2
VKLAVVIAALDEAERVAASVRSAGAPDVEVIVVDGGSRDATAERARAAGARVLEAPPGRARQLQAGARASGGDAVVFLHADTCLPPGFDAAVRTALADPRVAGGSFALRFDVRTPGLRAIEWGAELRRRLFDLPYGDQALFVRRAVLVAIGGVPDVPLLEDLDLVRAVRRHGRLARLPQPVSSSARRYLAGGVLRTMLRNWAALAAWRLGVDRARVAAWYRR